MLILNHSYNIVQRNNKQIEKIQRMKRNECPICDQPTSETTYLLKGIKKRLIQKNNKIDQDYQQIKEDQKNSHVQVFCRVLNTIILKQNELHTACLHKKVYRDFYRKMKCSQNSFKQNCQQILNQTAHKCFQLDTIAQQISMMQKRAYEFSRQGEEQQRIKTKKNQILREKRQKNTGIQKEGEKDDMKKQVAQQVRVPAAKDKIEVEPIFPIQQIPTANSIFYFPFFFPRHNQ